MMTNDMNTLKTLGYNVHTINNLGTIWMSWDEYDSNYGWGPMGRTYTMDGNFVAGDNLPTVSLASTFDGHEDDPCYWGM